MIKMRSSGPTQREKMRKSLAALMDFAYSPTMLSRNSRSSATKQA